MQFTHLKWRVQWFSASAQLGNHHTINFRSFPSARVPCVSPVSSRSPLPLNPLSPNQFPIWSFVTGFFHLANCFQGTFMLYSISYNEFIIWQSFYCQIIFHLDSFHLWLWWIKLQVQVIEWKYVFVFCVTEMCNCRVTS